MSRYFLLFFLIPIVFPLHAQDLIERTQMGLRPIEEVDLQTTNGLAITLQEKKQISADPNRASYSLFKVATKRQSAARHIKKSIPLNLQKELLTTVRTQASSLLQLSIPVEESATLELDLYRIAIHSTDFKVTTSTPVNQEIKSTGVFYNGTIKGNPNSMVAVSIFEDLVDILIQDDRGTYKITKEEGKANYLLYNDKDRINRSNLKCGVNSSDYQETMPQERPSSQARNSTAPEVPIYIEVSHFLYTARGNDINSVKMYVDALMAQATAIFGSIGIPIRMSQLKINTTPENYPAGIGDETINAFAQAVGTNFQGRLAHFITTDEGGGGIADTDVLCTFGKGLTGVSGTTITTPILDDVNTFVHELGHNFGAPHTQDCLWNGNNTPLDGCVDPEPNYEGEATCVRPVIDCPNGWGSIMSYCQVTGSCPLRNQWHPQVVNQIKARYLAATCLYDLDCPATSTITTANVSGTTKASISIETQGTVVVNGETVFSAPMVTLKPGFHAPQGQDFLANTIGCLELNGSCNAPFVIDCGEVFEGTTTNGTNTWMTYGDNGDNNYTGKEVIHTITLDDFSRVSLRLFDLTADLDMFIVEACSNTTIFRSTIKRGTSDEMITIGSLGLLRTYFVIIDGYLGATSSYKLECNTSGTCDTPVNFSCGEVVRWANILDGQNRWDDYDNGNIITDGFEDIYLFQQAANSSTTINLEILTLDKNSDLIVLDDCDNTANVIASSTTTGNESVTFTNATNAIVSRYIIVDGEDESYYNLSCSANFSAPENSFPQSQGSTITNPLFSSTKLVIQPNPANTYFSIQYQLVQKGSAQIELYNANGQQLKTLLPKGIQDVGIHQLGFKVSDLPEGIYYTVLSTTDTRIVEKLILLR